MNEGEFPSQQSPMIESFLLRKAASHSAIRPLKLSPPANWPASQNTRRGIIFNPLMDSRSAPRSRQVREFSARLESFTALTFLFVHRLQSFEMGDEKVRRQEAVTLSLLPTISGLELFIIMRRSFSADSLFADTKWLSSRFRRLKSF